MRGSSPRKALAVLALCTASLYPSAGWSFTSPYSDNFDSYAVGAQPTGWSDTQSHWSAQTGTPSTDRDYRFSITFPNQGFSIQSGEASVIQMTDLGVSGAPKDFFLSADLKAVTVPSYAGQSTAGGSRMGVTALADSNGGIGYVADIGLGGVNNGQMKIVGGGISGTVQFPASINTTDTYHFTLGGEYVGSSLKLTLTVVNLTTPSQTATLIVTDTTPLVNQQYFGFLDLYDSSPVAASTFTINHDNFAVPEPTAAGLLLAGAYALCGVRRRKTKAPRSARNAAVESAIGTPKRSDPGS